MTISALSISEDVAGSSYTQVSNGRVIALTISIQQAQPDTLSIQSTEGITLTIDQSDSEVV